MSSVSSKKLENKSVRKLNPPIKYPQRTLKINLKFVIRPDEKRVEKIINASKTKTKQRLRAISVLSDLIKTSYGMIRDMGLRCDSLHFSECHCFLSKPSFQT